MLAMRRQMDKSITSVFLALKAYCETRALAMRNAPSPAELYQDVDAISQAMPRWSRRGASGLSVGRKTFAMLHRDELVVKLDPARCKALVDGKVAHFFDPGHGRLMKAWVSVGVDRSRLWASLAQRRLAPMWPVWLAMTAAAKAGQKEETSRMPLAAQFFLTAAHKGRRARPIPIAASAR